MKKLTLLLCALFVVASVASASQAPAPAKVDKPVATAVKTHVVEAEVVSADVTAKTLTIKAEPNKTVTVEGAALAQLKDLKMGEKVKLTCRDNDKGEHQAITHIKVEKATPYGYWVVKSGETLSKIAKNIYSDANVYMKIFDANKDQLKDPNMIKVGQKLVLPNV